MTGRHRRRRQLLDELRQLRQALVELARLAAGDDSAPDTRGTGLRRPTHRRA